MFLAAWQMAESKWSWFRLRERNCRRNFFFSFLVCWLDVVIVFLIESSWFLLMEKWRSSSPVIYWSKPAFCEITVESPQLFNQARNAKWFVLIEVIVLDHKNESRIASSLDVSVIGALHFIQSSSSWRQSLPQFCLEVLLLNHFNLLIMGLQVIVE